MTNTNKKSFKHLPILFNFPGRESKTGKSNTVSILLKWETALLDKFAFYESEPDEVNILIQESEQEHQHFRVLLLEEMVSRENAIDKQQLIETVSLCIIRLMDTVFECTRAKNLTSQFKLLTENVSLHYKQTFQFIQEFFGRYFSIEGKAPFAYTEMVKGEIIKKLKAAKSNYTNPIETSKSLLDIVVDVITEKLSGLYFISISSITYIGQLADEIYRQSKHLHEKNLRNILYSLNFNEENFVMAEYERFAVLTPSSLSKNERIHLLKQEQKTINQLSVKLNCQWTTAMPSLKEQINGWLHEEIQFIELGKSALINQNDAAENYDKIQTSLSVAKLAVIIRLLVIDKIIINRQVAPALRTIAKVFTTLQKDDISFGSLETKYHAPDKATINAVKDILFKWINILGKL